MTAQYFSKGKEERQEERLEQFEQLEPWIL
jgi:hypothetical protein